MTAALLAVEGLTVTYGGVHANADVALTVNPGEVVGLIGPNGAGKSTFIDAVTGFTKPATGSVHFDGVDVTHLAPHQRADLGLTRTFQSLELFEDLTVDDNLRVAAERPTWRDVVLDLVRPVRGSSAAQRVDEALAATGLEDVRGVLPTHLSHGQRTLVGVARALAAHPKLVLLDEPAAGLDGSESRDLGIQLRGLAQRGTSVLLVDHDMGLVLGVCDRVVVLDFGRVIAAGAPREIRRNPTVIEAYLGTQTSGPPEGEAAP